MVIEKTAVNVDNYRKPIYYFENARTALKTFLKEINVEKNYTLFLPGYIGVSPNEGSGIYDPVIETGIKHLFYPLNKDMQIDISKLSQLLSNTEGEKILLIVHYFGYTDMKVQEVVNLCKKFGVMVIEDAAHALYTDLIDHKCGNYGDAVIYSFHKMLPYKHGGGLKINNKSLDIQLEENNSARYLQFEYDLYNIAQKRKNNASKWMELLANKTEKIKILHTNFNDITPQTFPIIIDGYDRDSLYFQLNDAGYGAVSLYHTMIAPLSGNAEFDDARWLSKHIINMPVHQDVQEIEIEKMASLVRRIVK